MLVRWKTLLRQTPTATQLGEVLHSVVALGCWQRQCDILQASCLPCKAGLHSPQSCLLGHTSFHVKTKCYFYFKTRRQKPFLSCMCDERERQRERVGGTSVDVGAGVCHQRTTSGAGPDLPLCPLSTAHPRIAAP